MGGSQKVLNRSFHLSSIIASPPSAASAALIPEGPVPEGSTVTLDCLASDGNIPITFTWISPNGSIIANQNIFQLRPTKGYDYGVYVCAVTNALGAVNVSVEVLYPGELMCYVTSKHHASLAMRSTNMIAKFLFFFFRYNIH